MCHQKTSAPAVPDGVENTWHATPSGVPLLCCSSNNNGNGDGLTVVIATDIYGITPFYRYLAAVLADAGHRVVVPDLFHRIGSARDGSREAAFERRRHLDDAQALNDLREAVDTCRGQGPYAVIGFCLGGTLALLCAAEQPDQATVTFYAFPKSLPAPTTPLATPVDMAERIRGPVLAFWGRNDYIDPTDIAELEARLRHAPAPAEVHIYDNAGHSFLAGLAEDTAETAAAQDAWQRTVRFLGQVSQ